MKLLYLPIVMLYGIAFLGGCSPNEKLSSNSAAMTNPLRPQLLITDNSFLAAPQVTSGRDLKREMLLLDYIDFERTCKNVWNMPLKYNHTASENFAVKHHFIIIPECNVFYNIENGRYTFAEGGAAVMKIGSGDNQSFSSEAECLLFMVSIYLNDEITTTNISPALKFKINIDSVNGKASYSNFQIINPDTEQLDFGRQRYVQLIFPIAFTPCEKLNTSHDGRLIPSFNLDYAVRRYRKPRLLPIRAKEFSNFLTQQNDGRITIRSDFASTNLSLSSDELPQQHTVNFAPEIRSNTAIRQK